MSAADRERQAAAEKANQAQLAAKTDAIDDLLWLMSDKRGRRIVWRLLSEAGIYQLTFTGDALTSAFKEGQRNQGLKLVAQITQHCPDRFSEMQKEARANERRQAKAQ